MKIIIKIWVIVIVVILLIFIGIKNYTKIDNNEFIEVIDENELVNTQWVITQFGSNTGKQMMSFTIEGDKNGLIIVDGGYKDNEEQYNFLKEKISNHNNIVDSWIITHFDDDHGGEFVRFLNESNDIIVKKIFVSDFPTDIEILKKNAPYEDNWSIYEDYLKMDLPQKIKVHSKDRFEIIGLKMEVLSSYEDWIDEKTDNLMNNGSLVFRLFGKKESILFCGDIQNKIIGDYLISKYKDKLQSDYLQVAHHGNNNLGEEFYEIVSPKIAFFCAPDWLIKNEPQISWYTVGKNKEFLEKIGTKILWYNTSPNIVLLK